MTPTIEAGVVRCLAATFVSVSDRIGVVFVLSVDAIPFDDDRVLITADDRALLTLELFIPSITVFDSFTDHAHDILLLTCAVFVSS